MKIRHLLIGLFAVAATVACKPEEVVETPKLEVDKSAVSLAATAGEASFNVTSNQSWVASADADWVSLEPASGAASEKAVAVKVTAEDNETTAAREATVTVKAGDLSKTVKVKQVAASETPAPDHSEWALVGTFGESNNWNPASDLYLSVLDEEYFVYYGIELTATTEFKFLKGGAWPPAGQEVGGNGLVEPNTIQPAGGSNIKVTEAGKYDIYLAADLTKFYIMSEGKLPSEAVEPAPVENQWGMMGCFVDNQWATDVPMTKEGEWIVAKGAQFTELTFKIRANASWADGTNIGRAPGSERAVVNGRIEVVTAEYSKANFGADAADIKLNGEPGTYDVYFSFENLEVYVMEQGFKPGEKEPQNPDPVEITYTVVGTLADAAWVNNAPAGLMSKEGDLYVAKNVPFVWNSTCYGGNYNIIEFKIVETGTWDGFAYPESNVNQYANAEITVQIGGENIALNAPEGSYDVYFDKANLKVWVMEAGFKPGEKEPLIPEEVEPVTEGVIWENDGTVGAAAWSGSPYRFAKEGMDGLNECCAQISAAVWEGMKIAPFSVNVKPATAETGWWQIRVLDGWWTNNDESGASDINPQSEGLVNNGDGTYTFQVDLASNPELVALIDAQHLLFAGDGFIINKMYFGDLPTPAEVTYTVTGTIKGTDADKKANYWNPSNEPGLMALEGDYYVAKNVEFDYDYRFSEDGSGEDFVKFKICETGTWNAYGQAEEAVNKPNTEVVVLKDGKDIYLNKSGVYDVYFDKTNGKVWVMEAGYKPGEEIARLDGYQWLGEFDDMPILFDLGIAEEGMLSIALPTMDESGFALHMVGFYEIEAADKSSGVIYFAQYDWEWDEMGEEFEIQYSELTANSVKVVCENVFGVAEPITLTRVENPYEIQLPGGGDEPEPQGPIANGYYRFLHSGSGLVMAPLAADATSGKAAASAEPMLDENKFKFTYDPDMTGYTIQDIYGRYLGQSAEVNFDDDGLAFGDICVATELPSGDDYGLYVWVVDNSYDDGTVDVYNMSMNCGIGYSAGSWSLTEATYETAELRPTLVPADVLIEAPVTGPKVVTVAEFLAATDNDIEYQVSGTVSGIYQAYNPSYGNISIYISDETGEMLAYRLSCEGINDPANTITKGDLITVKGKRTLYNETPQMAQGCVIVEHTDVVIEAPEGSATLSFADKANRTVFTTSQQVWEQNGIKLTNDKGSSSSNVADYSAPARFYKDSKITVEYAGMTKIEFTCNNSSYATALKSSITSGNVSVSGSVVTVTLDAAADSYVVSALSGGQVRMDSVTVYAE